jgi:signal transduction histidine kinase
MTEPRSASPIDVPAGSNAFPARTGRQSLGLIDHPCSESELLQCLIEGEAVQEELDQQAGQLVSLAEHACMPEAALFLNTLGHEMRVPLKGIIGMTEVLRSKPLPDSARDSVEAIRQSGNALLVMVDALFDFVKIEGGHVRIEHADFEIAQLLAESVQMVRSAASRKFLTIRTYVDPTLPPVVSGDAARIRQILLNLLGNAIKFTLEGEIDLRAELRSSTRRGLEIYFSVENNGSREAGTGGPGLTISKRLAELMGGTIGVTGSLFWFTVVAGRSKQSSR